MRSTYPSEVDKVSGVAVVTREEGGVGHRASSQLRAVAGGTPSMIASQTEVGIRCPDSR